MSVEFSGQITMSGAGCSPRLDLCGELARRLGVVVQDGAPLGERVHALAGHVALDGGDLRLADRAGQSDREQQRAERQRRPRPATPTTAGRPRSDALGDRDHDSATHSTTTNDDQRGAADPAVADQRGVDEPERQPAPRHTAPRDRAAQELCADPDQRRRDRPPAAVAGPGPAESHQAVEQRLEQTRARATRRCRSR